MVFLDGHASNETEPRQDVEHVIDARRGHRRDDEASRDEKSLELLPPLRKLRRLDVLEHREEGDHIEPLAPEEIRRERLGDETELAMRLGAHECRIDADSTRDPIGQAAEKGAVVAADIQDAAPGTKVWPDLSDPPGLQEPVEGSKRRVGNRSERDGHVEVIPGRKGSSNGSTTVVIAKDAEEEGAEDGLHPQGDES
jgi:hypothetical protein